MSYELIDCKPVPRRLARYFLQAKKDTGATLNSCLRTQRAVNFARSKGCNLSSQKELYNGYISGRPGFNPANPPGQSTHEQRSDAVAYPGPRGRPLSSWQVGSDWPDSEVDAVMTSLRRQGLIPFRPYAAGSEYHHINLKKAPRINIFKPLKHGSKGPRVHNLVFKLHRCGYLMFPLGQPRSKFTIKVEMAVKAFQHRHKLNADGIVGPHTQAELNAAVRWHKRHK